MSESVLSFAQHSTKTELRDFHSVVEIRDPGNIEFAKYAFDTGIRIVLAAFMGPELI
jgi:hypothetical protein